MNSMSDDSRATDDVFANSSAETVMENINFSFFVESDIVLVSSNLTKNSVENTFFHETNIQSADLHDADAGSVTEAVQGKIHSIKEMIAADTSFVANRVAMEVCSFPLKLYCPFCCNNYISESQLKVHIRNEHVSQLGSILVDNTATLLHSCQLCYATFYTDDLVTKHVAQYHQDYVITMFEEEQPYKYIKCGFCPYMALIKHKQHLFTHVEEKHFKEFKLFIDQKFSQIAQCEKLKYTLDRKNLNIPKLNTILMSIKENEDNKKGGSTDQSESSSTSQFINQNENQLSHEGGRCFVKRKVREVKNAGPGSDLPVRRKLWFDVPDVPEFKDFNKEQIISCSTNMKLVPKYRPKSSKVKPVSTWRSVFSFGTKKMNRSKPVSKFSTSTPNTFGLETHIRKTQQDKHNLITKKQDESKVKLISTINEEKYTCKRDSVTDIYNAPKMHNSDIKTIISEESYPVALKMRGDSFCTRLPSVKSLKQFECAICRNGFVNSTDLLTHTRQQHTGLLKLLQPPFKCGQCAAKFYKISYLVKHCRFHHTPRCLANELPA